MPDLEDDRGHLFPEDRLAPLPSDLAQSITVRPLVDAHMLLIFGVGSITLFLLMPQGPSLSGWEHHRLKLLVFGACSLAVAIARYAGLGPGPRTDRRALLRRAFCPVCLQAVDRRHAHGETITCSCGATWERRFM
jgi:hypothetical protein